METLLDSLKKITEQTPSVTTIQSYIFIKKKKTPDRVVKDMGKVGETECEKNEMADPSRLECWCTGAGRDLREHRVPEQLRDVTA